MKYYAFNKNSPLSNHYPLPVHWKGKKFKTAEHFLMWLKAMVFEKTQCEAILNCNTPVQAKTLGRKIKNFDAVLWEERCKIYIPLILERKLRTNPDIFLSLIDDIDGLPCAEASPRDRIWGTGYGMERTANGESRGENRLGKYWDRAIAKFQRGPMERWICGTPALWAEEKKYIANRS